MRSSLTVICQMIHPQDRRVIIKQQVVNKVDNVVTLLKTLQFNTFGRMFEYNEKEDQQYQQQQQQSLLSKVSFE